MQDTLLAQLNAREAELGYGGWDLRHKKQVVICIYNVYYQVLIAW